MFLFVDQTERAVQGCDWQSKWFPPEVDGSWLCRVRPLRLGCGGPASETVALTMYRINLDVANSLRISAGAILLRTGSQSVLVHCTAPVIVLMVLFGCMSTRLVVPASMCTKLLRVRVTISK